jgi:hypothetical protein
MFFGTTPPPPPAQPGVIFDFRQVPPTALRERWGALDDVVMGGVSASALHSQPDGALFTGIVSTDNAGGFVSVRTRNFDPPLDLSGHTGLELSVKGDGQRYKFFLRDDAGWDSVAYAASFDTEADTWLTVRLPFAQMQAVQRARTLPDHRPLDISRICSLQMMLSKFEYDRALNPSFRPGEFHLLIQQIGVY